MNESFMKPIFKILIRIRYQYLKKITIKPSDRRMCFKRSFRGIILLKVQTIYIQSKMSLL